MIRFATTTTAKENCDFTSNGIYIYILIETSLMFLMHVIFVHLVYVNTHDTDKNYLFLLEDSQAIFFPFLAR